MAYRYIEELATADIAFEATGEDLERVFAAACDATMNVMVEDLQTIEPRDQRTIELENSEADMLLFDLLQELIYYKDAEQLLLRIREIRVTGGEGGYALRADAGGEKLDPERHEQHADVKAVTLHQFSLQKADGLWRAQVILDI